MDIEKLRADWEKAIQKDKPHDAIKALVELERLQPNEARWSQRLGEAHRRAGQSKEAVDAFARAFERYFSRGFLPHAIAMAKLVSSLDAARGDLLEKSLPQGQARMPSGVPLPIGRAAPPPPLAPLPLGSFAKPAAAAPSPPKPVVKPPPLPVGDGPKPARSAGGDAKPRAAGPPPLPATAARVGPPPLPTSLKVVKPAPLSLAPDSADDEIRFDDAPDSSVEILLVEFNSSDVILLDDDDTQVDEVPPTRPVTMPTEAREPGEGDTYASLATIRLFASLSRDALVALADAAELVEFVPTAMIIVRDERAFALYAIVSGTARVTVAGSPEIRLHEGDVFGEGSLLDEGKRQADVRAETALMTLRVEKKKLDDVVKQHPEIEDALFDLLARRLIMNLMHTSPLFSAFEPSARLELAQKFEVRRAAPGTVIAERGRRSDGLYVLLAGNVMAQVEGAAETRIARGTAFGHASLLGVGTAKETIRAASEAVLLRMPAAGFGSLAAHYPPVLAHLAETANEPLPVSRRE